METASEENKPTRTERALAFSRRALVKVRAALGVLLLALAGLADQYNVTDLLNLVKQVLGESAKLGAVLIAVSVAYFVLKLIASGPKAVAKARGAAVDDPEDSK